MTEMRLNISDQPVPKEIMDIAMGVLADHTMKSGGSQPATEPFSVLAYIGQDLIGGLIGSVSYNWLHASIVWVREELRDQNIGTEVMQAAERRAHEMNLLIRRTHGRRRILQELGHVEFVELKNCSAWATVASGFSSICYSIHFSLSVLVHHMYGNGVNQDRAVSLC